MKAPFPENEEQRLAKLLSYNILDTQPETAYDDIVRLASYICQTPISLVSLVDTDRQWFKASVGLAATETSRDLAFCAHALLQTAIFVVPDAREDVRFANNPLVTGAPFIRFYAGAPLITADGLVLGTLCVIDSQPRTLSLEQTKALAGLGRQVVSQLELRLSHQKLRQEVEEHKQSAAALQQVQAHLQREREFLNALLENLTEGIVACDETGALMLSNRATRAFYGLPEATVLAEPWTEHYSLYLGDGKTPMEPQETPLMRAFEGQLVHETELVVAPKQGQPRTLLANGRAFFDASGNKLGAVIALHDISERKRAEAERHRMETVLQHTQAQMIQAEKMSGLGQLVAGVAHEINNPVSFIHGNLNPAAQYTRALLDLLDLYQAQVPVPNRQTQTFMQDIDLDFIQADLPKLLASMQTGTQRIREIVLSLRNFSRLDEAAMKAVDLHEGIDNSLVILGHRLKPQAGQPGIAIVRQYGHLPLVECYAGQLNQVFMNLLGNAIDALEEATQNNTTQLAITPQLPPTITICTEVLPHHTVAIRIIDNGAGIPEAIRSKIFDPFFTTKTVGKDTGLGLALSYKIVAEKHGGKLQCHSIPGQGTEFVIEIPIAQREPESLPKTCPQSLELNLYRGCAEVSVK